MKLEVREILEATGGKLESNVTSCCYIENISTDTRNLKKGDLFIALKGEKFDGHNFVNEAFKKGAKGAIIQKGSIYGCELKKDNFIIAVDNTLQSLGKIANYYLSKFHPKIVGITGSSGKTTTKEITSILLSAKYKILKNEENFNNEIGLPLTIFNLCSFHEILILEMAARKIRDIKYLCDIAQPDISVITNIGTSHIEIFGSRKNIFKAKSEIIHSLKPEGVGILNYDDLYLRKLGKTINKNIIFYGLSKNADIYAEDVETKEQGFCFFLNIPKDNFRKKIFLPIIGFHNIYNFLASVCVANYLNIENELIIEKIKNISLPKYRCEIIDINNIRILADFYNANPSSMSEALFTLSNQIKAKRKIAVLGDMKELGKLSKSFHKNIGKIILKYNIDVLVTVGEQAKYIFDEVKLNKTRNIFHFDNNQEAANKILKIIKPQDVILIKGSRSMKMEEIFEILKNGI